MNNNLLEKVQLLQSTIIISFLLLSNLNKNDDEKILDKNTEYYIFLKQVIKYNKIIKKYINFKNNQDLINNNLSNNKMKISSMIKKNISKKSKKIITSIKKSVNKKNLIDIYTPHTNDHIIPNINIKNNELTINENNELTINENNLLSLDDYNFLLENNEYFYSFFNNKNIITYFFKDKISNEHSIYFGGLDNLNNIKAILGFLLNDYSIDNIDKLLYEDGLFISIIDNKIIKINQNINNIFDTFDFLFNNIYNINNFLSNDTIKKINLNVNGYSLGGPFSQIFVYNILKKYKDTLNIKIYNIESWFGGNKNLYNELTENTKIFNTYNKKSILYFYNIFFQKYFKNDLIIEVKNNSSDCIDEPFPNGLIKYFNKNHLLSLIFKDQ
jgi:hypothetical protein